MSQRADSYRETLRSLKNWDDFLRQESGLPGPRGNLELAQVVAGEGDRRRFEHLLTFDAVRAPANTPDEFLAFCGVVGLGRLVAEGDKTLLPRLRGYASDPRWRTREAVAMALQRWGDVDMTSLLKEMETWATGSWLEMRAAAAAVAEPRLLRERRSAVHALRILEGITAFVAIADDRRAEDFKVLRKALGYCWSVVVAALPHDGKQAMEKWLRSDDKDVRWIMAENLKKKRLAVMDATWVKRWQSRQ